jgi:hypothetical protein
VDAIMSDSVCVYTSKTGDQVTWWLMFNMVKVADVDRHDLHNLGRKLAEYLLEDTDEPLTIGTPGGSAEITRPMAHELYLQIGSTAYRRW